MLHAMVIRRIASWFAVLILFTPLLLGQKNGSEQAQARYLERLQQGSSADRAMHKPGEVVARGKNELPSGKLKVKSYRLERVKLDEPMTLSHKTVDNVYHLIISGGPFQYGHTIWIDDEALSTIVSDTGELMVQFIGTPKFEDGATLSVTNGSNICSYDQKSKSILPDKLSIPVELRAAAPQPNRIRLRTISSVPRFAGRPGVAVVVKMSEPVIAKNESMYIQIGREEFRGGILNSEASTVVPYDKFWRLPDNAQVIVKWGRCSKGGIMSVRLNKSMLDH